MYKLADGADGLISLHKFSSLNRPTFGDKYDKQWTFLLCYRYYRKDRET
jgi:hypothetical protein